MTLIGSQENPKRNLQPKRFIQMKTFRFLAMSAVAICALSLVRPVQAAPVLDAGWYSDQIDGRFIDSEFSPYELTLSVPAIFSITDAYVVGDTYFVYDFGSLILTTAVGTGVAFPPSDATADAAWTSGLFSIGSVDLASGAHEITVQGDGIGGIPAGFFVRIDSANVPDGGATLILISLGLMAVVAVRRRLG